MPKVPFAGRFVVIGTDTTAQDVDGDVAQPGAIRCFDRLVAVEGNRPNVLVRLGFKQGSSIIWYDGGVPVTSGVPTVGFGKVWLPGDWRPFARFYGITSGDSLELYTFGYTMERME